MRPSPHRVSKPTLAALAALGLVAASYVFARGDWRERDRWQRPAEVMDALGIEAGNLVADVGSGAGYFTFHLARRVGPTGRVYAVDLDEEPLEKVRQRARERKIAHIETVVGAADDPRLPHGALDAILVVNTYHEMHDYGAMLCRMRDALAPDGVLGIIEKADDPGRERSYYAGRHTMPAETVIADAESQGLELVARPRGFTAADEPEGKRDWYFLVFRRTAVPTHGSS